MTTPITGVREFGKGQQYPPEHEMPRVALMEKYFRWSHGHFIGLDPDDAQPTQRQFQSQPTPKRLQPNMLQYLIRFWSDAFGEPPIIEIAGDNPRAQEFVNRLQPALQAATQGVIGDVIRYGCSFFWNRHALLPERLDPRYVFPQYPGYESDNVSYSDVVAIPYSSGEKSVYANDRIFIAEHVPIEPRARIAKLDGLTIGSTIQELKEFKFVPAAVVPVIYGGGRWGRSDFELAGQYVAELARRESAISEALDLHVKPHLAVPQGSLEDDESGNVQIRKDGLVIPIPDGERISPAFVSWEADFTAHESAIQRAEQRILRFSQIAPILATPGNVAAGLSIPSGSALRRLSVVSCNRLFVLRSLVAEAYKRVIPAQAMLFNAMGGELINIDGDDITVSYAPPFSSGLDTDSADSVAALVGSGSLTRVQALQITTGVSRDEAERLIQEEDSRNDNATTASE